jgi:hypothetical protein
MFKKYLLLLSTIGISQSSCYIKKEIPAHLEHKYKVVDPKKEIHVPTPHNLTDEDFKPKARNVKRRKSHNEILRAKDHHFSVDELEHHDILIDKEHIEHARKQHDIDLKKQKRLA